jgi:hypothetical protein
MKDRLVTVLISVVTTIVVMSLYNRPPASVAVAADSASPKELVVDRLIVRRELIVSDTGDIWEKGFEKQQIPRGLYAKATGGGVGAAGLWVRGRLIKTEIDDPFDDRFHAINRDGTMFRAPGHISWNVWLGDNWRQLAIIQGETLENSEVPLDKWSGGNHPGRLRFQSFRPHHDEPLTDATIGQGMMSLGGGGFGGGGLPYAGEVLQLWGGKMTQSPLTTPTAPRVTKHDGSGKHTYAIIAVGPQGQRTAASPKVMADGLATLEWDRVNGADAYVVLRDGKPVGDGGVLRIEGSRKQWTDAGNAATR